MRSVMLALAVSLLVAPVLHASDRYDPRLRFRTLTTPRFDIHFHQGEESLARRLAGLVEVIASELEPRLGRPRTRVHVILVDQTDLANGWATPLPYNLIEIVAASPRGDSSIGNASDWLRLVFTHEYTHVLHLERSRGFLGAVGRVFGRNPFFYPNLLLPPWQIEGIATYQESATSREGRIHAGDFRMIMDRAAAAGKFPTLDRASNAIVQWPGGQTPYLYGGFFHKYLADTYGEDSLKRLADSTAARLPFFGSGAFKKVYGKSLGALWSDFERSTAARAAPAPGTSHRLTHHGFGVSDPWFLPDGTLVYSVANPHGFPALMRWTQASGTAQLATRVAGGQVGGNTRTLVFDQVEYVRSVALQSDLYAYDFRQRDVRRLTRGARAGDPDLSPDGSTIAYTVQTADGRGVAIMPWPQPGQVGMAVRLSHEPGSDYASPRWSPDGRAIAAERRFGGASEIVVLDPASGAISHVVASSARGRNTSPVWSRDGRALYFASDREGGAFQIYAADLAGDRLRRLEGTGPSARSPTLSPDGATLAFVGYTSAGDDLFSLPLDGARWYDVPSQARAATSHSPQVTAGPQAADVGDRYSPLSTLRPRFWTPIIEENGDRTSIGAATAGADALGRHGYVVAAAWSTRGRPDWSASYAYDRWRPTFFADVSDDQEPWRLGDIRVREVNAGALLSFRRIRRTQTVIATFHAASEQVDCASCDPVRVDADRRALRAGWRYDASRGFGYSISDEEGFSAAISTEWTAEALGADGDASALVADVRGYRRAGPRHAVLAARVAAARAWGDEPVRRAFGAGGSGASLPLLDFGLGAIALVRGFDSSDVTGRTAVVGNLDYRVPITWIERGVGTWPFFLRSLHGAVFTDVGSAWDDTRTKNDIRSAIGAEFSADVVIGYAVPLTVSAGVAIRHDPSRRSRGATIFGRVGRAF